MTRKLDSALWVVRPKFGAAGGPDEIVLSDEGNARAFSVGAQVRQGPAAEALEALYSVGGTGFLSVRVGARLTPTAFGKIDQLAWGRLRSLGYVESIVSEPGMHESGVRLTEAGMTAVQNGLRERERFLYEVRGRVTAGVGIA